MIQFLAFCSGLLSDFATNRFANPTKRTLEDVARIPSSYPRANLLWCQTDLAAPVLVILQGPQHYISPGWDASKAEHRKVMPTWNYTVAHAKGRCRCTTTRPGYARRSRS